MYFIFFNFKAIPKASEYTGLVTNYVLSENLIVTVLDSWVLCCDPSVAQVWLIVLLPHQDDMGVVPQTGVYNSHCLESVNDILCMHNSHVYYNSP